MRHWLALITLALLITVAGCAAPPAPSAPTEAPAPAITLTFAAPEADRQSYAAAIAAFNAANPDVQVQFVPFEEAIPDARRGRAPDRVAAFTSAIAGAADTAALFAPFPEELADPAFQNLDPFIAADATFERADFFPAALPPADGPVTALPLSLQPPLQAYNRQLWERAGLPAPTIATTWPDLLGALSQLVAARTEPEIFGLLNGGLDSHAVTAMLGQLAATGQDLATAPTLRLDTPEVATALQQTVERVRSRALPAPLSARAAADDPAVLIQAGRAALWPLDLPAASGAPADTTGWTPFPAGSAVAATPIQAVVMSASTAQPDAAWRWLSFLSRQELPPPGNTQLGPEVVPARRSQLERSPAWRRATEEQRAALSAALERPAASYETQLATRRVALALADALGAVLDEGQSPEAALASAQAALTGAPIAAAPTAAPLPSVATPRPTPAGEVVTIRYLPFYQDATFIRPYVERFNAENPDVRVELRSFGGNDFTIATFADMADVFYWWGDSLNRTEFTATLDLQPLIDADLAFNLADYPAGLLAPYRRDGKLFGVPQSVYLANIGYNADLFEAAGVAPPPPDWTIDDFTTLARELTSTESGPPRYGFGALATYEGLLWYVANSGAQLVLGEDDALRPNFADPQVRSATREGLDLLRTSSPNLYIGYSPASFNRIDDSYNTLVGGSVAMWWDSGLTFMPDLPSQPSFRRGMLPLPRDPAGNVPAMAALLAHHISAKTEHPEAAWRWLRFLATEVPARYSGFPARISLAESATFRESAPLGSEAVYAAYKPLLEQPLQQEYLYRVWQIQPYWLFRAADRALQGGDLDKELTDAQFFTEQFLACVRGGEREGKCARQVDPSYDGELAP